MEGLVIDSSFWVDKKVLLTGHTGFKGGWLAIWLEAMGAKVYGFALEPMESGLFYDQAGVGSALVEECFADIREYETLARFVKSTDPHIVINMAAQPLVRKSYSDPLETYGVNVMGSVNLLEACKHVESIKVILNVTTDKCYENREWEWGYREVDRLGGVDPYSSSKACAEIVTNAFYESFFKASGVAVGTARAGNVFGGGDWACDRIIPDAVRAFSRGETLLIRSPESTRPWQHVLEPLAGYLSLCEALLRSPAEFSGSWNFGADDLDTRQVRDVITIFSDHWAENTNWKIDSSFNVHEAGLLKLDSSKAKKRLQWSTTWGLEKGLAEAAIWYKKWAASENLPQFTRDQIFRFQEEISSK